MLCLSVAAFVALAPPPRLRAAVIVPGFLNDSNDYAALARSLTERGLPTVVTPMPLWHWIPSIGGRSVRPVLERIDHAVRHVSAMGERAEQVTEPLVVPPIDYSLSDLWEDFQTNPGGPLRVGGSEFADEFPTDVEPSGTFPPAPPPQGSVAIIGCSAGGYMARIYLGSRAYGGRAFCGAELVHSLVTLGTPHMAGNGLPFENVRWVNQEPTPEGVRVLAVGATGTSSDEALAGAYAFCDPSGRGGEGLEGDGVTTSESALDLPGAEKLLLEGVTHYPWTAAPFADLIAPSLTKAYRGGKPWCVASDGFGWSRVASGGFGWLMMAFVRL